MVLTLMVFGENFLYHQQAVFAILTFLKQIDKEDKICILTDAPQFYKLFKESIDIISLNSSILKDWKGEHDFFWRIKIVGLQKVASAYPNQHILYIDSDTFLFGNLNELTPLLDNGNTIMHENEGALSQLTSKTCKIMWSQTKGNKYGNILVNQNSTMWNAGVIGLPKRQSSDILDIALSICDSMIANKVRPRLVEQLAFSLALNYEGKLMDCKSFIGHYWGNKDGWNTRLSSFFLVHLFNKSNINDMCNSIEDFNFNEMPLYLKTSSTKKRMLNKINKLFKDKNAVYLKDLAK